MSGAGIPLGKLGVAMGLAFLAYLPFLSLPLISDDYIQLLLGRQYGPFHSWEALSQDALYRCRASSILLTFAVDSWLGPDATAHRLLNVLLHIANVVLILGLGRFFRASYAVTIPAAIFFAIQEGHQEAVVWTAAMPELLVFLFGVASLIAWMRGLRPASLALFALALLSKESAVAFAPAIAYYWWRQENRERSALPWLAGFAAVSTVYAAAIFAAGNSHLHLNDAGTFSLSAPFFKTLLLSLGRLLSIWGAAALGLLWWLRTERAAIAACLFWMAVMLLPYSFLTYMDRVPSRHTYLASAGLAR
jgi:hypothetical protein